MSSLSKKKIRYDEAAVKAMEEREERLKKAEEAQKEFREEMEARITLAEERAERERLAREKVEEALTKAGKKRVKECIDGSPFTTHAFQPEWGCTPRATDTKNSTKTAKAWLLIGPKHVRRWTEARMLEYLQKADSWVVTHEGKETKLIDLILHMGMADGTMESFLNGTKAGKHAKTPSNRDHKEEGTEHKLTRYLWFPLITVMGGDEEDESAEYPVGRYINTRVRGCVTNTTEEALLPVSLPYSGFYKNDKTIETISRTLTTKLPAMEGESKAEHFEAAQICARVMVEIKPDAICPKPKKLNRELDDAENIAYGGDLYDYMQSTYFDPKYNPVAQVVTYALVSRTNCVMIHTLNHLTIGIILEEEAPDSVPITLLSRKFDCTSSNPPFESKPEWSIWEVLIRFILASKGEWYRHHYPDSLKEIFKQRIEESEKEKKGKKRPAEARDTAEDSTKEVFGGSGGGVEENSFPITSISYADLWAPLRFAIPATHSIEEESTLERLPGDAELLSEGRMGPVYHQPLQGFDCAIKLLIFYDVRQIDGRDQNPIILRDEMRNELDVYRYLAKLQGTTIPKLLWYGELLPGMCDALVTEYVGSPLPEKPSPVQIANCLAALNSLHQHGVLHGDVAMRNFVYQKDQVFILDFGFSVIRTDEDDETWESEVKKEMDSLGKELGISLEKTPRKRLFEG